MRRNVLTMCALAIPLAVACASSSPGGPTPNPGTLTEGSIKSSTTGLEVSLALASSALGDEGCTHDESADLAPKSCGQPPAGAPQGTGTCGGPCRFTSVQIALTSGTTGGKTRLQVTGASLVDASTGAVLQALSAYTPLEWNGAQYVAWDEIVAPSSDIKASYTLSPPTWSTIDTARSYSREYKVRIIVRLDDATLTLESPALTRDPPVAT